MSNRNWGNPYAGGPMGPMGPMGAMGPMGPMGPMDAMGPMGAMPGHPGCSPQYCPPKAFPTQYDPPLVSPGQQYVKTNLFTKEVSHIHPSHTTTVNKHLTQHKHYFPHTESCVNECYQQHFMCGVPYKPC
ncbi:CotD family spore coat protein [Cytobacillus sp. Hz8]|uniref:CotD family spore coat protein n=1 Tax=Cytobacillus sp. Hz8 TaxID=3347168 RepID=UPI0035DDAE0D